MSLLDAIRDGMPETETDPVLEKLLDDKKAEVETAVGHKVIGFVIPVDEKDNAFFFLRPATAMVKRRVMDKMMQSISESGMLMLTTQCIREHSDPRLFQDTPENADLINTACSLCSGEVKIYQNTIKKK